MLKSQQTNWYIAIYQMWIRFNAKYLAVYIYIATFAKPTRERIN